MLDIKWIRENPKALADALVKRGEDGDAAQRIVDDLVAKDEARREHLVKLQEAQERRNAASKEIGNAMRNKDMGLADKLKAEVGELKTFIQSGEATERELDKALADALAVIPNVPLDEVPVGKDEHDNVEIRKVGTIRPRPNWVKEHFEIGEALGLMDFERAAKLSGARFTVLKGRLARLERALGQFMLDLHTSEHGYEEIQPPLMVNSATMFGTGQLPKFEDDLFQTVLLRDKPATQKMWYSLASADIVSHRSTEKFLDVYFIKNKMTDHEKIELLTSREFEFEANTAAQIASNWFDIAQSVIRDRDLNETLWLVPTAEVPLTNLVRDEIMVGDKLPLRYTALTPCFRQEAGSAGRDTRGMLRQHQFYKVELVSITDQENSLAEHDRMTACAEEVLKRLGLPFRTVVLCTGDMGFGSRKTYDIEVWLPGQNAYREISSCSVCGDFQARRMDARYRPADGKGTRFVHTLNGSGTAVGRALIAVLENYQNEDGSVTIPEALLPYMGGLTKIEAK